MRSHIILTMTTAPRLNVRSIALPTEHGGWGFTLEPILLGLLVAPSTAGWALSVAALAVFLARRPSRLVLTDVVRRRWLGRSSVALGFAGAYIIVAAICGLVAMQTASTSFWSPLLVALPLAVVALSADARNRSRTLIAELAGAIAMGATVALIVLAADEGAKLAYGLWLVLMLRAVATVVLVRSQIRRVHGRDTDTGVVYGVQIAAVAIAAAVAIPDIVPWLAVVAIGGIGIVAVVSLRRPPVAAKVVGWTQMAVGLGVVVLTALGVWVGW